MKHLTTPTNAEIQARMDRDGECFLRVEDRSDGYHRIVFVEPEDAATKTIDRLPDDVRRAVMMARENRRDIAALTVRVETMQNQIGGLK